jgi:hypothetical protein
MSGTTADIIPIVIVPVLALAFLLVMVNYANSHPQWGSRAPADTVSARAGGQHPGSAPEQRRAGGSWPASRRRCGRGRRRAGADRRNPKGIAS